MSRRNPINTNNTNQDMAAIIAQQMAAVVPNLVGQIHQAMSTNNPTPPNCTFKHFNSCNPPKFLGTEGATGLLQWFESMENTFLHSDCPENLKVRHATSVFQKRALTWWNGEKRNRRAEAAIAMTWTELKQAMTNEFCPRNEMRKLETEFWELKQDSGESQAYTARFHELSLLVPHLVTPLTRCIEKYITGLPMQIQDTVFGSQPATLEDAIRIAATLSDNHVKAGTLTRKGGKKADTKIPSLETSNHNDVEPSPPKNHKRKTQNFVVVTNATPINTYVPQQMPPKHYTGAFPLCNTCNYHHPTDKACRFCTICGRYGHYATTCRTGVPAPQPFPQHQLALPANGRACFECGDPNHLRNVCPRLLGNNQGAAPVRVFQLNAPVDQVYHDAGDGAN